MQNEIKEIYFASDHAGFELKGELTSFVKENFKLSVKDFGPYDYRKDDDYPDFIFPLAEELSKNHKSAMAVIIGGSGQGEAICANRFANVRAAVINCENFELVKLAREHNDANVLSFGARFVSTSFAKEALRLFVESEFSGEERHKRRIEKLEKRFSGRFCPLKAAFKKMFGKI